MAVNYTEESRALSPNFQGSFHKHVTNGDVWHDGWVRTEYGIVVVVDSSEHRTLFEFVYDGRVYDRRFSRQFWPSYLITLAKRFARDVATKGATDE